jgi:hypothetical protein
MGSGTAALKECSLPSHKHSPVPILKHLLVVCASRVMQVPTILQLIEVWLHLLLLFAMLADP